MTDAGDSDDPVRTLKISAPFVPHAAGDDAEPEFVEKVKEIMHFDTDNVFGDSFLLSLNDADSWEETISANGRKIRIHQLEGIGCGGYVWNAGLALCELFDNRELFPLSFWKGKR